MTIRDPGNSSMEFSHSWSVEDLPGGFKTLSVDSTIDELVGAAGWNYKIEYAQDGFVLGAVGYYTCNNVTNDITVGDSANQVRFYLNWAQGPPYVAEAITAWQDINAASPCADFSQTDTVTNATGNIREYYWVMNEGNGWVPAQNPEGELYGTFTVQPGQSIDVTLEVLAADNPNCADFALQSCALFGGEIQDPNCGTLEVEYEQPSNGYPSPGGETGGGGGEGPVEYKEGGGIPSPFGERPVDPWTVNGDSATRQGQEEIIQSQQDLARFQSGNDYRNTQDIIAAIDNIDVEITEISEATHLDPSEAPDETNNTSEETTSTTDILTDTDSILDDVATGLPPSPIIPTTIGTSSTLSISWGGFKGLQPTIFDMAQFSTQIDWFRLIIEWFLYIFLFFAVIKITRSAFAG